MHRIYLYIDGACTVDGFFLLSLLNGDLLLKMPKSGFFYNFRKQINETVCRVAQIYENSTVYHSNNQVCNPTFSSLFNFNSSHRMKLLPCEFRLAQYFRIFQIKKIFPNYLLKYSAPLVHKQSE